MSELPETTITTVRPKAKPSKAARRLPPFHVILENDDHHSFEFVVETLQKALCLTLQRAIELTAEADSRGLAIVWTGSKEVAELKAEQIQSFHEHRPDGRKLGPLGVRIEPAA